MIANLYTVSSSLSVFYEFKHAFVNSMTELGNNTNIYDYGNQSFKVQEPDADINFIIIGNAKYLTQFFNTNPKIKKSYKILLWFEQWPKSDAQIEIRRLFNFTFDMFEHNHKMYKNSIFCPLGWSQAYETHLTDIHEYINCYSFGAYTPTRQSFIKEHGKKIKFDLEIFSRTRDLMIMASKINLIIPARPGYYFPQLRYLLIACKKKFVVSTPHVAYTPYIPNKHFKLFEEYDYWINKDKERQLFAESVYNDLKTNYNYTVFLNEALKKL